MLILDKVCIFLMGCNLQVGSVRKNCSIYVINCYFIAALRITILFRLRRIPSVISVLVVPIYWG